MYTRGDQITFKRILIVLANCSFTQHINTKTKQSHALVLHAYTSTCTFIFPLSLEGCRDFHFFAVIRNLIIDSKFHIEVYSFIDNYLQWCLHCCQLMHQNNFLVLYISYQTTSLNLCGIIIRDPTLPRFVYQQTVSIHGLPVLLNCNKEVKRKR